MLRAKTITLDNLIKLYELLVEDDRKSVMLCGEFNDRDMGEFKMNCLKQDNLILGALKYAKANGYTGEE